jgi:hypothetical protein
MPSETLKSQSTPDYATVRSLQSDFGITPCYVARDLTEVETWIEQRRTPGAAQYSPLEYLKLGRPEPDRCRDRTRRWRISSPYGYDIGR